MFRKAFKILVLLVISVMSSCSTARTEKQPATNENLIIYYDPEIGNNELLKTAKEYGSEVLYVYKNINGIAVKVPADRTVTEAIEHFSKIKGVLSVVKDSTIRLN